jgi:hypothetical protein
MTLTERQNNVDWQCCEKNVEKFLVFPPFVKHEIGSGTASWDRHQNESRIRIGIKFKLMEAMQFHKTAFLLYLPGNCLIALGH